MRHLLPFGALVLLAGCSDVGSLVSSGSRLPAPPAHVALNTSIAASVTKAGDAVSLEATSSYLRRDGTLVPITAQRFILTDAPVQAVPVAIDVGGCLDDPDHSEQQVRACRVVIRLALTVNNRVVDIQTVGPLDLAPGAKSSAPEPVSLAEISSIEIFLDDDTPATPGSTLVTPLGSNVQLHARARDINGQYVGDREIQWLGGDPSIAVIGQSTGLIVTMGLGNAQFTASFGSIQANVALRITSPPAALTVLANGTGAGRVKSTPAGIDCQVSGTTATGTCTFTFPGDAQVTLQSTATTGSAFRAWGDACVQFDATTSCVVTMSQPRSAVARFDALRRLSVLPNSGDGRGRITGPSGLDCQIVAGVLTGTCSVLLPQGTTATLVAIPFSDEHVGTPPQRFTGWGGACSGTAFTCVLPIEGADQSVRADVFDVQPLAVTLTGAGAGVVVAGNGGSLISCSRAGNATSGTCAASIPFGSTVTLLAQPSAQSSFVGWSGACAAQQGTSCTVPVTSLTSVQARFEIAAVPLNISITGSGSGVLRIGDRPVCTRAYGSPGTTTCVEIVEAGSITISASALAGSHFDGFGGDCSGMSDCTLSTNAPRNVTLHFTTDVVTMSLSPAPGSTASGDVVATTPSATFICHYVNGSPAGSGCIVTAPYLSSVTFRVTPSPNSALLAWGHNCASSAGMTCTILLTDQSAVSATFGAAINVNMTIGRLGAASGQVSFSVPGVPQVEPCVLSSTLGSTTCTFALPVGMEGVFRATPLGGSTFSGFTGPCSDSGNAPWPTCTYRGIGFARDIYGNFSH